MPGGWMAPFRLIEPRRRFGDQPVRVLDVGCGNHSPSLTKRWMPACHYTGLDRVRANGNDAADESCMDAFVEMDLRAPAFEALPDAEFDVILVAHVIEHLRNGDEVVRHLLPKLRPGGMIYIEYPGRRSLRLPSMRGSLNFHDDPTHVRLYDRRELGHVLVSKGMSVLRSGTRRDWRAIVLTPIRALVSKLRLGYVPGGVFWDLLGFAEYVIAVKPGRPSSGASTASKGAA